MATQLDQNNEQNNTQQTQIDPSSQQQQQTGGGGDNAPAGGGGGAVPNAPTQRQGSGRYNNLQNYINANQGAGQRLYQGIGNNLNRETAGTEKKANTQASQIAQNVQASRDTLNRGQGYYDQMQDQNFNAENFANDQNKLQDFAKFKAGQNVDEAGLQNQQQQLSDVISSGQNLVNQRAQQAQTEEGRFGLLQNTFGGRGLARPQYSQGQQRLDQLFLQSGQGNNVQNLQNIVQQKANQFQGLQGQATQYGNDIGGLANQEQSLGQNLQTAADSREKSMMDMLNAKVGTVNTQRDAERQRAEDYYKTLVGQNAQGNLFGNNSDLSNMLGLKQGMQTYNAIDNLTNKNDLFNVSAQQAQGAQDVASQQDASVYDALAKLKFGQADASGNFQFDPSKRAIQGAGNLENVLSGRNDEMSVANRIAKAKEDAFKTFANNRILSWVPGQFGAGIKVGQDMYGGSGVALDPGVYGQNSQVDAWLNGTRNNDNTKLGYEGLYGQIHPQAVAEADFANGGYARQAQEQQELNKQYEELKNQKDQFGQPVYSQEQLASQLQPKYQDWAKQQVESSFDEKMKAFLDHNNFFNYLSDNGVKKGDQDIANYGYGSKPAAGSTKGIYQAPGQVNLDDIINQGANLTMSPEERMMGK